MSRRRSWVGRGVLAVVIFLALVVGARVEHTSPRLLPMALFVLALVGIVGLVVDSSGYTPADWQVARTTESSRYAYDGSLFGNVRLLENHLNARQADSQLRARLQRLTDTSLGRQGLRRGEPGVAERLGPTLAGVLDGPPRQLSVAEIEECIRRIEELAP